LGQLTNGFLDRVSPEPAGSAVSASYPHGDDPELSLDSSTGKSMQRLHEVPLELGLIRDSRGFKCDQAANGTA